MPITTLPLPRSRLAGVGATLRPDDPIARALTWSIMASALSSGLFYTVSALFFVRVVGLEATTVGIGLTIAGAVGVAGSFGAGYLADRVGAHRVLLGTTVGQGLALIAYAGASSAAAFVLTACGAVGLRSVQGSARAALLARCFTGVDRVDVRARLRVVTNLFIGLGTCLAAVALVHDTAAAYTAVMILVGVLVLGSYLPLRPLPRLVQGRSALPGSVPSQPVGEDRTASRSPLRDRRYVAVVGLNAVLAMQFGLQTVGVPLWVVGYTSAPPVTVSALLVMNTVLVTLFQVRAARGTHEVGAAGRAVARAGLLLALACTCYAAAANGAPALAVVLLVAAALAHTMAEMWGEAGAWGLAFELADERRAGAYQGLSQTSYAVGAMLAPLVVTATAIDHGATGWAVLGGMFALAGILTGYIARLAARRSPAHAP